MFAQKANILFCCVTNIDALNDKGIVGNGFIHFAVGTHKCVPYKITSVSI